MYELCFLSNISADQWAAWTQALGSVAAIFAAIWISNRQHKLEVLRAKEEKRLAAVDVLHIVTDVVGTLYLTVGGIDEFRSNGENIESKRRRNYFRNSLLHLERTLDAIPAANMPSPEAFRELATVKWWLGEALRILGRDVDSVHDNPPVPCSEEYGLPWRPIVGSLRDAKELLIQELSVFRDGATRTIGSYAEEM